MMSLFSAAEPISPLRQPRRAPLLLRKTARSRRVEHALQRRALLALATATVVAAGILGTLAR